MIDAAALLQRCYSDSADSSPRAAVQTQTSGAVKLCEFVRLQLDSLCAGAFAYDVRQPPQHRPDSGGLCQQCPVPARVQPQVFHLFIHLKLGMLTINRCRLRI